MDKNGRLPAGSFQEDVIRWLGVQEVTAYLVGGCVRDRKLGRISHDLDAAVDGNAVSLGRRLADRFGGAFYILDSERGAARALLPVEGGVTTTVDLTRIFGQDIYTDLAARDFTVNAMALTVIPDSSPELIDPHDGQKDLQEGRLRAVSHTSLQDDPVRILRAVRISYELGLHVDPVTESLMREAVPLLERVSPERVRDELCRILALSPARLPLTYMDQLGVLKFLFQQFGRGLSDESVCSADSAFEPFQPARALEVIDAWERLWEDQAAPLPHEQREALPAFRRAIGHHREQLNRKLSEVLANDRTQALLMKWVMLSLYAGGPDRVETMLRRFHFSRVELRRGRTLASVFTRPGDWVKHGEVSRRQLHRFYREARDCGAESLLLYLADRLAALGRGEMSDSPNMISDLIETAWRAYFDTYDTIVAPPRLVDGNDVMSLMGMAQGPHIRELLEQVQEAQVEGTIRTREEALRWLENNNELGK